MPKGIKLPAEVPAGAQFAALCFRTRKKQKPQILLITSRGSGRWILPKGWPMEDFTPWDTAAEEAYEEAGVLGRVFPQCLGKYDYVTQEGQPDNAARLAYVFAIQVTGFDKIFPEMGQRQVKWHSQKKAAELVREPKLKKLLIKFDPNNLNK